MKRSITPALNLNFLKKVEIAEPIDHVFDLIPLPLFMINETGNILIGNRAAEKIFSSKDMFLEGQHIRTLFPDRLSKVIDEMMMNFLEMPNTESVKNGSKLISLDRNGAELLVHVYFEKIVHANNVILLTFKPI